MMRAIFEKTFQQSTNEKTPVDAYGIVPAPRPKWNPGLD
jgi:hypothetical protein